MAIVSKPPWLRVRMAGGARYEALKENFRRLDLHTVCEEARCPNIGECWGAGTATIMILGETCTRGCRFCAVNTGDPAGLLDPREPEHVAQALARLDLAYVVLTMVDRDDLLDGGAAHVAQTVQRTKQLSPQLRIETLVGDFQGVQRDVEAVAQGSGADVFSHNVEVVPRLQRRVRDARCSWQRSLDVLRWARAAEAPITKSSLMLGIGEEPEEVSAAMAELRAVGVDILTLGQYLQPTAKHAPVHRYVTPEEFEMHRQAGLAMGFRYVAAGPLVRSSYRAAEAFMAEAFRSETPASADAEATADRPVADRYGRRLRHLAVVSSDAEQHG